MLLLLPPELVIYVLSFLDLFDILNASQSACVEHNPNSTIPRPERLSILKTREEAWLHLTFDFFRVIPVEPPARLIRSCIVRDDIYLLYDNRSGIIHYINLPSTASDSLAWKRIDIEKRIIGVGLNIPEHDLLAVLTSGPSSAGPQSVVFEVRLLQLSTGKPHPQTSSHILFVAESPSERPSITIALEIVGVNLVLVAIHPSSSSQPHDYLYFFNWMNGELKLKVDLQRGTYRPSLVFLNADLVLVPNAHNVALDIWKIPSCVSKDIPSMFPIVSLELLPRPNTQHAGRFECCAQPNPTAPFTAPSPSHSSVSPDLASPGSTAVCPTTAYRKKPFHTSPQDAVVVMNIDLENPYMTKRMFVRRADLLEAVRRSSTGNFGGDEDDEENERQAQVGRQDETAGAGGEAEFTSSLLGYPIIKFSLWGAGITCCVQGGRYITASGTRCLFGYNLGCCELFEFNPLTVYRGRARTELAHGRGGYSIERRCVREMFVPAFMSSANNPRKEIPNSNAGPPTEGLNYLRIDFDVGEALRYAGAHGDVQTLIMDEERIIAVQVGVTTNIFLRPLRN
ncbi:hypothetical protein H0H81_001102 [Sphagnurus paluster]|uniref:F-box domain-containing protein n=1 Tax=Sphagnurus paluster TaxID=117069 RepID=A0A9P7FPP2_9AGAR|nr:hypothetical protein H0H81_001102 [Sphagnurus paluster]